MGTDLVVSRDVTPLPPIRQTVSLFALTPRTTDVERFAIDLPIISNYDDRTDLTPMIIGSEPGVPGRDVRAPAAIAGSRVGERTDFPPYMERLTRLTSGVGWEEGVFLTMIDGQGRRSAEVVEVTPPEATALIAGIPRTETDGPFPNDFEVRAATDGDDVVVAWLDLRADAPGYYARRYRCAPLP